MPGLTANSSSQTMTSGDVAADQAVTGYIRNERVALGLTPAASTSYLWAISLPAGSSAAKASITDTTASTPSFVPDIGGTYVVTCQADGATTYTLRLSALDTAASEPAEALRFTPRADAQVGAPSAGRAVYYSATLGSMVEKDSAGTVRRIQVAAATGPEYGELYWSTPAATTMGADTWTKAAGTTTLALSNDFTMPVNNRLRHNDADTEIYQVTLDYTITAGGNNKTVWVGISKGGATPAVSTQRYRLIATGGDAGMGSTHGLFSLASGEYVEAWVKSADGTSVTIEKGALTAVKVN